jgi:predicted permease
MRFFSSLAAGFRNLFAKKRVERDLAAEMNSYLDLLTDAKVRAGLEETAARRAAAIELGGIEQIKEEVREVRLGHGLETLLKDLRFGMRSLGKSPGFTAITLLTLALGIGANTAIFSIVNAVVLRPLPYRAPEELVKIWPGKPDASSSKADYVAIKGAASSFDDLAGYSGWGFTLTGSGDPAKLDGARATANLFRLLGVQAALGRTFLPDEDQPGHERVALLGYGLWQSRFGGDPAIVGRALTIDGAAYSVIGVLPQHFDFLGIHAADLWLPATLDPGDKDDYSAGYLTLIGRLKKGVTSGQAQSEVAAIARHLAEKRGLPRAPEKTSVIPLQSDLVANVRALLFILFGVVGFVLLIACANVANLQLARTSTRQRELAIRAALGATRGRLVRQLLTENCLLALLGGAAGIALAWFGLDLLLRLLPLHLPRAGEIAVSRSVLGFSLGISLLTGFLFGLAPAWQVSRPDLQAPLKEGGRTSPHRLGRLRGLLVIAEMALALMLVVGAGLLIKSFARLEQVDPGFKPDRVISFQLSPGNDDPARARVYYRQVIERLENLPGVKSAGGIHILPMSEDNWNPGLKIEDQPLTTAASSESVNWRLVTPNYFRTMNIPLLAGRRFNEADNENAPAAALVNETLARKYWPGRNPLGKRVQTAFEGKQTWASIVGVVGDIKQQGLRNQTEPEMYRPYMQHNFLPDMTVMVRSTSDPTALAASIRGAVWSVNKNVPITHLESMDEVVARSISQPRSTMILLSIFAGIGLILGVIGIYGVISYTVTQRSQEIGIRMALGAATLDVLKLVLGQGMKLVLCGIAIGLAGAFALTRLLSGLLFGVSATDPATFAIISALLVLVALFACYLPARRATRVDPVRSLRYE